MTHRPQYHGVVASFLHQQQLKYLWLFSFLLFITAMTAHSTARAAQHSQTNTVSITTETVEDNRITMTVVATLTDDATYGAGAYEISYQSHELSPVLCELTQGLMGICNITNDTAEGIVYLSAISAEPLTGTIQLATLTFERPAPSTNATPLEIETITFADGSGLELAVNSLDGLAAWDATSVRLRAVNLDTSHTNSGPILLAFSLLTALTVGTFCMRYLYFSADSKQQA